MCRTCSAAISTTIEDILHSDYGRRPKAPKGKYVFGTVTVGDKGQIVIPVKARRVFDINPGDDLVVLGDINSGLALLKADFFLQLADQMKESGR